MVATRDYSKTQPYLDSLSAKWRAPQRWSIPAPRVRQLHWGGGTPTYLNPADIQRLMTMMRQHFSMAPDAEISCEVDPRELSFEHPRRCANPASTACRSGCRTWTRTCSRRSTASSRNSSSGRCYDWSRELGFSSINLDLIVGLPKQTVASFNRTLERVVAWAPDRLAVFSYAHVPWMKKHQALIQESDLPDAATRLGLQEAVNEALRAGGYVNIGLDHFARPDDEMVRAQQNKTLWRNFQGYTTHKDCDILAFGVSSISQTETVYMQNEKNLKRYQERIAATGLAVERGLRLNRDDQVRREAITRLMCDLELDTTEFGKVWDIDFADYFADAMLEIEPLAADGLVEVDGGRIGVTPLGRLFLRNIGMCFDRYLKQEVSDKPRYSRTA
jgi:oxygen-independent coproporphyrinogen III oxidase